MKAIWFAWFCVVAIALIWVIGTQAGVVAVLVCVVGAILIAHDRRVLSEVRSLRARIEEIEQTRVRIRCNGLFGRLRRALDKARREPGNKRILPAFARSEDPARGAFVRGQEQIPVDIRVELGPADPGQFIAYNIPDYPAIHGCEDDIESFARQIHQAFEHMMHRRLVNVQ